MNLIEVEELRKQFDPPKGTVAVDGISFEIAQGEIFSLLGPNGAGKTTTISILSCLLAPSSGDARVGGHSVVNAAGNVKRLIGVVPQEIALYPDLSARENLVFWGRMYGMGGADLERRVDEVLELIGLVDKQKQRIDQYSGRDEAPREHRRRPAARAPHALPGRADRGHRPAEPPRHPRRHQGAERAGHDRALHHPLHGRGRGALPPRRHHGPRQDDRPRHPRGAGADHRRADARSRRAPTTDWTRWSTTGWPSTASPAAGSRTDGAVLFATDANSVLPRLFERAADRGRRITGLNLTEPNLEQVFLPLTGRQLRD